MIYTNGKLFVLGTDSTAYSFRVTREGLLEHLHYGGPLGPIDNDTAASDAVSVMSEKVSHAKGNAINYRKDSMTFCEDMLLEQSSLGKGDFRDPFVMIEYPDGSTTSDFIFESYRINKEPVGMNTLPTAMPAGDGDVTQLVIVLKEAVRPVGMELIYTVYPHCDVITRRTVVVNYGTEPVILHRVMSTQVDLDDNGYKLITFNGHWTREMMKQETRIAQGMLVNRSLTGTTSNRANSFVMLADADAGEDHGEVFGFHLLYSGDHYESACVSGFDKTRFLSGIEPTHFSWTLGSGERFEAPEAAMTFTEEGYRGISRSMHAFIRRHITRGRYRDELRPILLNSWEAAYFDIDDDKLISLAKKAVECGIELFVMDDGWFKGRNNDMSSLGDWTPDKKKLPHGIRALADRMHKLGIRFGLWVEPEMISEDSDIYRAHPEYAVRIPGRENSPGRNQMLMDLTNPEVVGYIKDSLRKVFGAGGVDYVKWDMNRMFSDVYSHVLPAERQGETMHRWVLGLYDILGAMTEEFPDILFEGCASGGCRFDPGVLCYFPQIWASDDTDAIMRTYIQEGYSYGYPMSVVTAHVSGCPNHQTLRTTPMSTRFNIALFGDLGYEFNLCECDDDTIEQIKAQTALYKEWRDVLQTGDFYRFGEGSRQWMCVSKDKQRAVCVQWEELTTPNRYSARLRTKGLDEQLVYNVYTIPQKYDIRIFGDLINQIAPIHIRKDSLLHKTVAHFVKMDSETLRVTAPGAMLNNAGIRLAQAFGGSGYDDRTRLNRDFESRLYFFKASVDGNTAGAVQDQKENKTARRKEK